MAQGTGATARQKRDQARAGGALPPAREPAPEAAGEPGAALPAGEATPVMAQYLEIKAANPDSILWYRMGDFYELFFEDAVVASEALGIVLTKRGKHLGQDIPMCGVPVHRADEYLQRLIRRGFRVAVCEQLEDPAEARKRGSKAVVRRDVVRLVTPGTLTEDSLLDARARNYLTALHPVPRGAGEGPLEHALASLDLSTGEFEVGIVAAADLGGELVRLSPGEIIAADATLASSEVRRWLDLVRSAASPVPGASFDSLAGERALKSHLGVADLAAFGSFTRPELAAVGALLRYVELTQIGRRPVLRPPRRTGSQGILVIDAASRSSLEIVRSSTGEKAGSLLAAIDRTVTGAGARELAARLASPLTDVRQINARLDAVAFLIDAEPLREEVRRALRSMPDVARAISRLALLRGSPRDLAAVRDGLAQAAHTQGLLEKAAVGAGLPADLAGISARLAGDGGDLAGTLSTALVDAPTQQRREGGWVREGFRPELDAARHTGEDSRRIMAELEARYIEATGIKSLKVRHNNILGYYIEVSAQAARPLLSPPLADTFRHRQTMASAVRFTTAELSDVEVRIATAAERALALEEAIFGELSELIGKAEPTLCALAAAMAELDCIASLAEVAASEGYCPPIVSEDAAFEIRGGRHPVVEQALKAAKAGPFIENDCVLVPAAEPLAQPGFDEDAHGRIWLVTGPNMAGKSTFLRQNALIALLAQIGSWVPAKSARIGVVDRLFSRVGAADDIARGRSTFMVEMVETAAILNQATDRSLVILDEIGRGTATFDGLSIAWATLEYLHDVTGARSLFATHYHELTSLTGRLPDLAAVTMDVREFQDEIVFLHRVRPGAADRSYGIQVAKLAGLPGKVVGRAREVLKRLERSGRKDNGTERALEELPLFAATRPEPAPAPLLPAGPSALERLIDETAPDDLTPRAALDLVYRLKRLRGGSATGGPP